jgi:two-component system, OmpR family, sensor kinase
MSRLPIRVRLTAAFALATALVLAGAGLFVYLRLRADLDDAVNDALRARARAFVSGRSSGTGDANEGFAQVLTPAGAVLRAAGPARRPGLGPSELARASQAPILLDRRVQGIEGAARVLARRTAARRGAPVVAVGQSLQDRDEALAGVIASFSLGGPVAVLLASIIGYALASAGLAPVEAMRRQAAEISLKDEDDRLPLPAARDEIRRLGQTLNAMLERLRRSFERERRFVADASHELRTPVAVVKAELEGALRAGDCGPAAREGLLAAVEECDHLAQLAEDLLIVARAADGRLPVRRERLDARSVLEDVRARFADRAAARGRPIALDAPDGLSLDADPLRLRQALGNLLDNALRHGAGDVVLASRPSGEAVEVEVSDEGAGFATEFAERAFERFARGEAARTRGGAGLGLAIVQAVTEAHGGRAEIVPGPGATVRVSLPRI